MIGDDKSDEDFACAIHVRSQNQLSEESIFSVVQLLPWDNHASNRQLIEEIKKRYFQLVGKTQ